MNNNIEISKNWSITIAKYLFHICNVVLIIFYLYPGSILGCLIYDDCKTQPQLTGDFIVSSNHVYVFIVISFLGFVTYQNKNSFMWIIIYLFFISVFLELSHKFIPERGFEMKDLAGNIIGVVISLIIFRIIKIRKKNG